MDIDKIDNIIKSLDFNTQNAGELHHLLYNSLLTFNGILITAFSIIFAINPSLYAPFIVPYFLFSFVPVVGIVIIVYQIRQSFIDTTADKIRELYGTYPDFFKGCSGKFINNICKKPTQTKKRSRFIYILDKLVIVLSLLNPIFLFIILYVPKSN